MYLKTVVIMTILTLTLSISLRNHKKDQPMNYYINLDADNWIYGGDQKAIDQARFVGVIQHSESHQCPLQKPYTVDGSECFQCPIDHPIFNMYAKQCQRCPKDNVIQDHQCKA